jgi:hypothetical protein
MEDFDMEEFYFPVLNYDNKARLLRSLNKDIKTSSYSDLILNASVKEVLLNNFDLIFSLVEEEDLTHFVEIHWDIRNKRPTIELKSRTYSNSSARILIFEDSFNVVTIDGSNYIPKKHRYVFDLNIINSGTFSSRRSISNFRELINFHNLNKLFNLNYE